MRNRIHLVGDFTPYKFIKEKKTIFFDEYIYNFYNQEPNGKKKSFFFSYKELGNIDYYSQYVIKKHRIYKRELSSLLNKIHGKKYSSVYWGLILDKFLFLLLNNILIESNFLKKIYKKNKNLILEKVSFENSYLNTQDYLSARIFDNSQIYIRYIIAKNIGFKHFEKKKASSFLLNYLDVKNFKLNILQILIKNLVHLYVKLFNPTLIIESYLNKRQVFNNFFLSLGKVLCVPYKYFFNNDTSLPRKKKSSLRNQIKVNERDDFDRLFNKLIKDLLPLSYLENYEYYEKFNKKFKCLTKIGTAILINDDNFKFLSSYILEKKRKLFLLPHGGMLEFLRFASDQDIEKKYGTKLFRWSDRNPLRENILENLQPYKFNFIKKNLNILFYPTAMMLRHNYHFPLSQKNHPYANCYFGLYEGLSHDLKKKVKIKNFPTKISNLFMSRWKEKYKFNFFVKNKKNIFNQYKLIIINDYSTPLCQLIYTNTPFIIIDSEKKNLNSKILKKILRLKKINILFDDCKKASTFLNKHYNSLDKWWLKALKSKIYCDLKKDITPEMSKSQNLRKLLN
jgi:putative transferase (TIGR04331 family)